MDSVFLQFAGGKVPIVIVDAQGNGVTGVAFGSVTGQLSKNGGANGGWTPTALNWAEAGNGLYWATLDTAPPGDTGTLGPCVLQITYAGVVFRAPYRVISADEAAIKAVVDTILARTDVATSTRLAAASYIAPNNAGIATAGTNALDAYNAALAAFTEAQAAKNRIGVPINGTLTADVRDALNAALGRFVVVRDFVFNPGTPDLGTCLVRLYDSQANADTDDGATGLIVQFTKTVSYVGLVALAGTPHQPTKVVGS